MFIVFILLYYEAGFKGLILGTVFSGLAEFYWGLKMGALILPMFASAGAFLLVTKFFNIRSKIFMTISGVIMFVVFWETSVFLSRIL